MVKPTAPLDLIGSPNGTIGKNGTIGFLQMVLPMVTLVESDLVPLVG